MTTNIIVDDGVVYALTDPITGSRSPAQVLIVGLTLATPQVASSYYWADRALPDYLGPLAGTKIGGIVKSFGDLRNLLPEDGRVRESTAEITLYADGKITASEYNVATTPIALFQTQAWQNAQIVFYLWDINAVSLIPMWTGYLTALSWDEENSVPLLKLTATQYPKGVERYISDSIDLGAFPKTSRENIGEVVPRVYGSFRPVFPNLTNYSLPALMGYPVSYAPGIVVDEDRDNMKFTVRFSKNDGLSPSYGFAKGTDGDPSVASDFFVVEPSTKGLAMIDPADITTVTNDSSKSEITMLQSPRLFVPMWGTEVGDANNFSNIQRIVDGDPMNYVLSSASEYALSYYAPQLPFEGTVTNVRVACRVKNVSGAVRTIQFGLWNTVSTAYVGARFQSVSVPADSQMHVYISDNADSPTGYYFESTAFDAYGTTAEFKRGGLFSTSAGVLVPIQVRLDLPTVGSRDGVQIYDLVLIFYVKYPTVLTGGEPISLWHHIKANDPIRDVWRKRSPYLKWEGNIETQYMWGPPQAIDSSKLGQIKFAALMQGQADTAGGMFTGAPGGLISKAPDILRHLYYTAQVAQGVTLPPITTSGQLGNFIDPQDNNSLGEY